MQVIAGKYGGRKLKSLDSLSTRPTLARVKESMFSMLDAKVQDAVVLDLFAGSGALGLECISRGAKKVYFVDGNKAVKPILEHNLQRVKEDYQIIIGDYIFALQQLKRQKIKFDLVFLDPPYNSDYAKIAIKYLAEHKLLASQAIIAFESESKNCLPNEYSSFIILKNKPVGRANITLLEYCED